jgi:hypothetical protein
MNDPLKSDKPAKAPYQPPLVVRVSLRPEEAVLGHCKITGSAGPGSAGCGTPVPCTSLGS